VQWSGRPEFLVPLGCRLATALHDLVQDVVDVLVPNAEGVRNLSLVETFPVECPDRLGLGIVPLEDFQDLRGLFVIPDVLFLWGCHRSLGSNHQVPVGGVGGDCGGLGNGLEYFLSHGVYYLGYKVKNHFFILWYIIIWGVGVNQVVFCSWPVLFLGTNGWCNQAL
jgi:hypothetical protein